MTVRVAIIGAGIGAEHLAGYRALPDRYTVATLCDLDVARAEAVVAGSEIAVTSDFDSVLADASIDLIDICLPPHLHFEMSMAALKAGKHVVCENRFVRRCAMPMRWRHKPKRATRSSRRCFSIAMDRRRKSCIG